MHTSLGWLTRQQAIIDKMNTGPSSADDMWNVSAAAAIIQQLGMQLAI